MARKSTDRDIHEIDAVLNEIELEAAKEILRCLKSKDDDVRRRVLSEALRLLNQNGRVLRFGPKRTTAKQSEKETKQKKMHKVPFPGQEEEQSKKQA